MNWLKLAPYIAGAFALIALIAWHKSQVHQADSAGYARAMAEVKAERDTERALNEHKREVAERDYQTKVSELETRVDQLLSRPEPAIRMCKPSADQVRVPNTARGVDDRAAERPAVQPGPDIGPSLLVYGRDCEAIRRQLTALQEWVKSVKH